MKVKRGLSIEITDQLSSRAAQAIASWIGGYTVIYNQKTIAANADYDAWLRAGKPEDGRPQPDTAVAHLQNTFEFLREIPSQIRRNAGAKWFEAMNAALKGVRKRPEVRAKHRKRNCYVTNELFRVQPLDGDRCVVHLYPSATKKSRGDALLGAVLPLKAEDLGNALYLSRQGRRFWLSISHDAEFDVMSEEQIRHYLSTLNKEELAQVVNGYDVGVVSQAVDSLGRTYHYEPEVLAKLAKLEQKRRQHQKRYSRIARANDRRLGKGKRPRTNGEKRALEKAAKVSAHQARIRDYNAHCLSKRMAEDAPVVAAFEAINVRNLMAKPKPKQCESTGRWLSNGAKSKASLNRGLSAANLGRLRIYTEYKLRERGKLMVTVRPHYSSQECSQCGHTEAGNRPDQATFKCQSCGHQAHADHNAAINLKQRGIAHIQTEAFQNRKTARRVSVRRKKAPESASLGGGGRVRPDSSRAVTEDAPNSPSP